MIKPYHSMHEIAVRLRTKFASAHEWQSMVKFLRFEENCSKAESIFILSRYFDLPYEDALNIVHNSEHWSDRKISDEQLNREFWDAVETIRSENSV